MRRITQFAIALTLVASSSLASAQLPFPFQLPGLDRLSGKTGINRESLLGNLGRSTKETTEAEEINIGQEFAATLLGAKPLVADPRLQRYVNVLGRYLASQTERPNLPWTFGVLDDPGFNAFATPGGFVFVTRGLVERMRSEAELAGVLAHEIAHVLRRHHLAAVQKNAGIGAMADVIGGLTTGRNQEAKSIAMNLGRKLYASGLDKSDEFEADQLGVVIAARAGYDAYGLPSVLQLLQSQNEQDGNFSLMFRTHPTPAARIDLLDRVMANRFDALSRAQGRPLKERLPEFGR